MMLDTQIDFLDINGPDKLSLDSVDNRNAIISHYAQRQDVLYIINHSGGKDSCATYERIKNLVPASQIAVIHASLGIYEHNGVIDFIKANIDEELIVVRNEKRSLLDGVLLRGLWFGHAQRWCTSGFKTAPIDSAIRKLAKERGATVVFSCLGLRAAESNARSKKNPLYINKRLTTTGSMIKRTVYDFYPIFEVETAFDVWDIVNNVGKEIHPAYGTRENQLNDRLSCLICFCANVNDMRLGALENMDVYHQYLAVEKVVGHTLVFRSKQKTIKTERFCIITGKILIDKHVEKTALPIPLNEHIGLDFDELAVQKYVKIFTARRAELLNIKAEEEAEKLSKRNAKHTKINKADENQLAMAGL